MKAQIKGMNKLLKQLEALGKEGEKRIAQTTEANAKQIEADAKILSPVDTGRLKGSISASPINKTLWKIGTLLHYAPYVEFGTGTYVFYGQTGELEEAMTPPGLFKAPRPVIREVNLYPQPYLYPAFVKGRAQYIKDLEGDLNDLTK